MIFGEWANAVSKIAGMQVKVSGKIPTSPFYLVSNHLGYMDIAAFRSVLECFFVAKSEVADWFLIGRIARDMGTVFINRENRRDILRAGNEINEKTIAGESVIIFCEGTSSDGKTVLPFKSSFFEFPARNNFPVAYAAINYRTANSKLKPSELICWHGDTDFLPHLWRLFQIETFTATINFGKESVRGRNRKELAASLHSAVKKEFTPVI